jgi:hypothetical protein
MKNVMFALVAVAMLASCAESTEETVVEETVVDTTVVMEEPVEGGSEVAKPEEVEAIAE